MKKILVINGPNLNFLGIREKSIYGTENYSALLGMIQKHAADLGIAAECSYAIHDALRSVFVPKVEIHISDIHAREAFREVSVTAPACDHQIVGHGLLGYLEAMDWICAKKP